ncbi:MAG: shikimate kinase [Clostridia bacterium]|nr:shikimate kinase [Clostridia bacterium]MBQ7107110.1 shikimate kinase [Clostridia bacterium]
MKNIVLIGMPGSGKSTLGVLLAKIAGFSFLDSDLLIQSKVCKKLYRILDEDGADYFKAVENEVNSQIDVTSTVIATGGSVVYGNDAMENLKKIGTVVYIKVSLNELLKRIDNMATRGIVKSPDETFKDLYAERTGLYEKYADITVPCEDSDLNINVQKIATALGLSL